VGGVKVVSQSGGVLNGGDPKGSGAWLPGGDSHSVGVGQFPDPSMGEECLQADLDTALGADTSSLDSKAARILSKAVAATWEVHQLREILPTASRVPGYSEKPVTQKRFSHACLIIEILAWIQNSSSIYLQTIDVWGWWITRCGRTKKWQRRCTVRSVPLLQEVIRYIVKQYFYKIRKIAYLKIVTCIIDMMYYWLCIRFCIHSSWHRNVSLFWSSWLWRDRLYEEVEVERRCQT
jgi:hypothetical protein